MAFPLYLDDDSESRAVHAALIVRGFDAVRATDSGMRGRPDEEHLEFAAAAGRTLVTANRADFLRIHADWMRNGSNHAGLIIVLQQHDSVGKLLARLERILETRTASEMLNSVEFLSNW